MKKQFRNFDDARKFVQRLNLKSSTEWREYCKSGNKPDDIPVKPHVGYKNKGWINWGDWLGTNSIATFNRKYRSFIEARKFVHSLKLKNQKNWYDYCKSGNKPDDIPANPDGTYKNKGWKGYGDWLGTGRISNSQKTYLEFVKTRKFARSLKLKNRDDWADYCKSGEKPDNIPSFPNQVYKNKGWVSMGDFLGTGNIAPKDKTYISFRESRKIIHSVGLKSTSAWRKYCNSRQKPNTIPTHPHIIYKNKGWISWGDWFGTGIIATQQRKYISFDKARKIIQSKNLKSSRDWKKYTKEPKFPKEIPKAPDQYYKNKGWVSMGDWLGSGTVQPQLMDQWSFDKAREFVQKLGLKSGREWRNYSKTKDKPDELPATPNKVYKNKGWVSMGNWLGTGVLSPQERSKNFLKKSDARKIVHGLAKKHNIRTNKDWIAAVKKGLIPDNIPASPWWVYRKKKK